MGKMNSAFNPIEYLSQGKDLDTRKIKLLSRAMVCIT